MVLLKNTGLLPLHKGKVRRLPWERAEQNSWECEEQNSRIAVLGEAAVDEAHKTYVGKGQCWEFTTGYLKGFRRF